MNKPNFRPKSRDQYDWLVKVIILGDQGVGKTNILMRYCENKFSNTYLATIGVDFKIKKIQKQRLMINEQNYKYGTLQDKNVFGAYGIIYTYSVTDERSFLNVENWMKSVKDNTCDGVCQILVGNKTDLENERRVKYEDGELLGKKYSIPFLECSAKDGRNIQQIFEQLGSSLKNKLEQEEIEMDKENETKDVQYLQFQQPEEVQSSKKCSC